MAKLVVITKGLPLAVQELGQDWVTIGRGDANTFQIVESSISSRHCEVRLRGNELLVRDLLSTNGTFVEGKKITEATLKSGQVLKLGEVELRFEAAIQQPPIFAALNAKAPITPSVYNNSREKTPPAPKEPAPVPKPAPAAEMPKPVAPVDPSKKFHVLFVDDSMAFIETFGGLCVEYSHHAWELHSATTADRALLALQEGPIDLVVLDIGMPMVDGIQLLGIITRRYPGMKIAVLTGNASDARRAACLSGGAELFIEKPTSSDGTRVIFNLLNDMLAWSHRDGFSGALRQVGLQDVVQMECVGGHSSVLEIRNTEMRGQIFIEAGAITHAAVGSLVGRNAFYRLLSLKGGEFQVKSFTPPPQRTIDDRWELLLMDAARLCDEETVMLSKSQITQAPPPAPAREIKPAAPAPSATPSGAPGSPSDEFVVVATYEGKWIPNDGSKK
jgi:CheY-like chemotaxis protein